MPICRSGERRKSSLGVPIDAFCPICWQTDNAITIHTLLPTRPIAFMRRYSKTKMGHDLILFDFAQIR